MVVMNNTPHNEIDTSWLNLIVAFRAHDPTVRPLIDVRLISAAQIGCPE